VNFVLPISTDNFPNMDRDMDIDADMITVTDKDMYNWNENYTVQRGPSSVSSEDF
jgi:hypothetical protein